MAGLLDLRQGLLDGHERLALRPGAQRVTSTSCVRLRGGLPDLRPGPPGCRRTPRRPALRPRFFDGDASAPDLRQDQGGDNRRRAAQAPAGDGSGLRRLRLGRVRLWLRRFRRRGLGLGKPHRVADPHPFPEGVVGDAAKTPLAPLPAPRVHHREVLAALRVADHRDGMAAFVVPLRQARPPDLAPSQAMELAVRHHADHHRMAAGELALHLVEPIGIDHLPVRDPELRGARGQPGARPCAAVFVIGIFGVGQGPLLQKLQGVEYPGAAAA